MQKFSIRLAESKPDWWGTFSIVRWKGQPLTLSVTALPAGSKALSQIDQTDKPKYPANLYHETLRPRFHYSVKQGWSNDVDGLVYYQGEYHLFYAFNPFGLDGLWNMSWGHAVSKDLVHWRELDPAIYPTLDGKIYSGSAVIDWKNTSGFGKAGVPPMVAIYTVTGDAYAQCISYSVDNGRTFTSYDDNPVVQNVIHGNRDPKVFRYEPLNKWVMAFFLGIPSDPGPDRKPRWSSIIRFMNSDDLKKWTPRGVVESDPECPDLFPLPLDGDEHQVKWVLEAADGSYQVGSFDGGNFVSETPKRSSRFNAGYYYAAQTANELPKGDHRRIQMVWFRVPTPGMNFTQAISVPLELTLHTTPDGPRLCSWPVHEVESLRTGLPLTIKDQPLIEGKDPLAEVKNGPLDIEMTIDPLDSKGFEFTIQGVPIRYNTRNHLLSCMNISTPVGLADGRVRFRVLSDVGTLEIFADSGEKVIPQLLSPTRPDPDRIGLRSLGGKPQIIFLQVNRLNSIW
jgi:sucrose-6-phosphate hydrolase SacC (GH32 family)